MKTKLLLCLMAISYSSLAQWHDTNCSSPQINCVAASGNNVFAGAAGGGVRGSLDNGDNWSICCFSGMTFPYIWSLSIDSTNIYSAGLSGIYRSTDSAITWVKLNTGLADTNVHCVVRSGNNMFAATGAGVYFSSNNGTTWSPDNTGLVSYYVVKSLGVSGGNIFAGTAGGGLFESSSNGGSWTAVNNVLTNGYIGAIAVDGAYIYLGTSQGVIRSNDNGANWSSVNNGLSNFGITNMAANNGNIVLATSGGVYLSVDSGNNWSTNNTGLPSLNINGVAIGDGMIYASIDMSGVWRRPLSELIGINDITVPNFDVAPNPFTTEATITSNHYFQNGILTIYNALGQVIEERQGVSGQSITINGLNSGAYFVRLTENKKLIASFKLFCDQ